MLVLILIVLALLVTAWVVKEHQRKMRFITAMPVPPTVPPPVTLPDEQSTHNSRVKNQLTSYLDNRYVLNYTNDSISNGTIKMHSIYDETN